MNETQRQIYTTNTQDGEFPSLYIDFIHHLYRLIRGGSSNKVVIGFCYIELERERTSRYIAPPQLLAQMKLARNDKVAKTDIYIWRSK